MAADPELPPLPTENMDPWFAARDAFDQAVKENLEGRLSETELTASIDGAVGTAVPPLVADAISDSELVTTAIADAVAEVAAGGGLVPGEENPDDEFTVRFDDGDPFLRANETRGIHDTKLEGMEIEQLDASSGYAFSISFRNPTTGVTRAQFGIRDDGVVEVAGAPIVTDPTSYRDGTVTRPISSGPGALLIGHSMAAGMSGALQSALAARGVPLVSVAVGGETSRPITARTNAQPILLTPVAGTIPASGPAEVALTYADGPPTLNGDWPMIQGATSYPGELIVNGTPIAGTFSITRASGATAAVHHVDDKYYFTRTASGSSITASRPSAFRTTIGAQRRDDIAIIWLGRNNYTEIDQVTGDLDALVLDRASLAKRWLVLSELTGRYPSEVVGQSGALAIKALNDRYRRRAGRRYINVLDYLIDYGLADAGMTPTSQDTQDIADRIVPVSLRSDTLHLNTSGNTIVVALVIARLLELGWI